MKSKVNRREFCAAILGNGALLLGAGAVLTGCGGSENKQEKAAAENKPEAPQAADTKPAADPCTDFSNVEPSEIEKRNALGYVEKSPISDNTCENCKLFVPGKEGSNCGGCMLFKGPVFLDAYCTYWADPAI